MIDISRLKRTIDESYQREIKITPQHTNRASSIGHPCMRYLVLSRLKWQEKKPPEIELQKVFEEGHIQEDAVINRLKKSGFKISEQQQSGFEAKEQISGHMEGLISHEEIIPQPIPFEVKSMSPYVFDSIVDYKDMLNHKFYYIRGYIDQLQVYMYMKEMTNGLFILKNKVTGDFKFIVIDLDLDYVDEILKKSESINSYVRKNEIPSEMVNDISICERCPFKNFCYKDKDWGIGIIPIDDINMEKKINRLKEIEETAKEYEVIKDEVSAQLKNKAKKDFPNEKKSEFMIGNYLCRITKSDQKFYKVPDEIKEPYGEIKPVYKLMGIIKV